MTGEFQIPANLEKGVRFTNTNSLEVDVKFKPDSQSINKFCMFDRTEELKKDFWSLWQQYRNDLYRCCLKWMNNNPTNAEDALSRAMLKAWEKVQKQGEEINNIKAWLTRITQNLCVDIHRENERAAKQVEKAIASFEDQEQISFDLTPENAMDAGEKKFVIRRAIDNLPTRLRETFILCFREELSYQEIAQQQNISYQNVCKRISQARAILREELRGYFIGEDSTKTELQSIPSLTATESLKLENLNTNAEVELIVSETLTLSDSTIDAHISAIEVEKVESVFTQEPQDAALSVQPKESVIIADQSNGKLQVKKDCCRWEEVARQVSYTVGKQVLLHSQVWRIKFLLEVQWRVWMDSGGCWLH